MNEVAPAPLDLQNSRSWYERFRIRIYGFLFQTLVDILTIPRIFARDRYRYKISIDTVVSGKCRLCIYTPRNSESAARGVVMHIHGGGWTICRPETEAAICRYLADNAGVVVVAPDYRKAPEYPYPHALEQCYAVASWIASGGLSLSLQNAGHSSASSLKIDSTRIGLSGCSAGGNLACALTILSITRPLPYGTTIRAQGLLYPSLNLEVPYEEKISRVDPARNLPRWASRFFFRAYLPPPRNPTDPFISPALAPDAVVRALPPTVILTAEYDYLAYEADEFAQRLHSLDVQVRHCRFENVGHGFDIVPARDQRQRKFNENARNEAWSMIAQVFREMLG